jgi:hypothetical protein
MCKINALYVPPKAIPRRERSQLAGTAAWIAGLSQKHPAAAAKAAFAAAGHRPLNVTSESGGRRLLLTTVEFALSLSQTLHRLCQTIFSPSHTLPLITHTNTPPVTNHVQDRSHVPLEPRRRSPHPCKATARFSKPTARRPKKHQTPNTKPPDQST